MINMCPFCGSFTHTSASPADSVEDHLIPALGKKRLTHLTPTDVRSRVYDLMRAHLLQSVKIGRSRRVPAASLREYVAALARDGEYE